MKNLAEAFVALRDQYCEFTFHKDTAKHLAMGELRGPLGFGGKARRLIRGNIESVLPHEGECTLFIDRTHTQLGPDGPITEPVSLMGIIEGVDSGLIRIRSRAIKGESLRIFLPTHVVLFFSTATSLLAVEETQTVERESHIFELQGLIDPKRKDAPTTPPMLYVPKYAVAWITEKIALTVC